MVLLDVVFSSLLFGNGVVLYYIEKILIDLNFFECKVRLILWLCLWNVIKVFFIEK